MALPTTLKTGIIGTVIAAVCCFTPVLVVALGAVGLAAWVGWLDYVLFAALAAFLALTAYGAYRWKCAGANAKSFERSGPAA